MKTIMMLGLLALLSACGGGGSDEEPVVSTLPVQCGASGVCK